MLKTTQAATAPNSGQNSDLIVCLILGVAVISAYLWILLAHMTNTPLTDDVDDALYFSVLFRHAGNWVDKITLLFFQYDETKLLFNKLVYSLCLLFQSHISFITVSLIGAALVLAVSVLVFRLFPESLQSHWLAVVIIICLFNMSHYLSAFWPMSSLNNYGSCLLAALSLLLLSQRGLLPAIPGCAVLFVLVLSMGNGMFMLPLAALQIAWLEQGSMRWQKLGLLSLAAVASFAIFVPAFLEHSKAVAISRPEMAAGSHAVLVIEGFFVLLGALPFTEKDTVFLPLVLGGLVAAVQMPMVYRLIKDNSRAHLPIVLFLAFCFVSILLCAVIRVSQLGLTAAFNSRYKFIVGIIWAITAGCYLPRLTLPWRYALVLGLLAMTGLADYRSMADIRYWQQERRDDITRWILQGNQSSLGLAAWFVFSHEIVTAAVRDHLYNPFSAGASRYLPESFAETSTCPPVNANLPAVASGAMHNEQAVGLKIAFSDPQQRMYWVAFCSPQHNYLAQTSGEDMLANDSGKKKLIMDSRGFVPGEYRIVFLDRNRQPVATGKQPLRVLAWKPVLDCDEAQMDYLPSNKVMVRNICTLFDNGNAHGGT